MCIRAQLVTCTTCVLMHSARARSNYIKRVSHETKRAFDTRLKRDRNEVKMRQKRGVKEVRTRSPLVRTRRSRSKSARGIPCPWAVLYLHNNMFHCQSNQYYTHSHSHHLCPDTSGADLGGGLWGLKPPPSWLV